MYKWERRAALNFYPIIKQFIDNNLLKYEESISIDPLVQVDKIAKEIGIKDIIYISPEKIDEKYPEAHAYLDNDIIYVRNDDNKEKQRFSIAHEIFHYSFILNNYDGNTLKLEARQGKTWINENAGSDEAEGEDIAEYFAANLLVPTERFILWEDKSNEEIAQEFGVEISCIIQRRKEIEYELEMIIPKNISSDVKINTQTPLSLDELNMLMEECSNNDGQS